MEVNKYTNYFFLTEGVSNYGGAQLLVLRKATYLRKLGINVKIIVQRHRGEFFLEEQFREIPILYLADLERPFSLVNRKSLSDLRKSIKLFLGTTENSMLETHSLQTAVWGEYFSSILGIKHIICLLNEDLVHKYRYYPGKSFFNFKYKRGELFGTNTKSLEIIFQKDIKGFNEKYINVSFNPDELVDASVPPINTSFKDDSITITTLCRLEKGYVKPMILSCIKFAKNNPKRMLNLIVAGGTIHHRVTEKLRYEFLPPNLELLNLKIIFTGYITSLGKDLFRNTDIFVGMGTASINAISQGCATLNIDPRTNKTSGIFGIDTDNFAYPFNNQTYEIEDKLSLLIRDTNLLESAKQRGKELFNAKFTVAATFKQQMSLLSQSANDLEHYKFKRSFFHIAIDFIVFYIRKYKINQKLKIN
jgi:hypothetical protein